MSCPHPLCSIEIGNKGLFNYHLVDIHGKTFLAKETLKRKHGNPDEGIKDEDTMLDTDGDRKRPKFDKKKNTLGQNVFRIDHSVRSLENAFGNAIRSINVKSEVSARLSITPQSSVRRVRSSSYPPTGAYSALTLNVPAIGKVSETDTQTFSSASKAKTISYCGMEYAIDDVSKRIDFENMDGAENWDAGYEAIDEFFSTEV